MIREAKKEDILKMDYLGFLFNKEIQKNSQLNKLKKSKYLGIKSPKDSEYFSYFSKGNKIFIMEENKRIVGFISGRILKQKSKKISHYGKLDDLYILPRFRGKGHASNLVKSLLQWFRKNKVNDVVVFASPNKPIQKYYSNLGFKVTYYFMHKKM